MKVSNDFFRQFEELNYKLDSLLEENKLLRKESKKEKDALVKSFKFEKDELNSTINLLTNN